jgi:hypothetical protein
VCVQLGAQRQAKRVASPSRRACLPCNPSPPPPLAHLRRQLHLAEAQQPPAPLRDDDLPSERHDVRDAARPQREAARDQLVAHVQDVKRRGAARGRAAAVRVARRRRAAARHGAAPRPAAAAAAVCDHQHQVALEGGEPQLVACRVERDAGEGASARRGLLVLGQGRARPAAAAAHGCEARSGHETHAPPPLQPPLTQRTVKHGAAGARLHSVVIERVVPRHHQHLPLQRRAAPRRQARRVQNVFAAVCHVERERLRLSACEQPQRVAVLAAPVRRARARARAARARAARAARATAAAARSTARSGAGGPRGGREGERGDLEEIGFDVGACLELGGVVQAAAL